jgi:hypothetical protein
MPRQIPFTAFLLAASVLMPAQTTIDLSTQSRNIAFSRAVSTRAFKTGNSLPPICSVGETFFLWLDLQPTLVSHINLRRHSD